MTGPLLPPDDIALLGDVVAAADLAERCGAREFKISYSKNGRGATTWCAQVQFRGTRLWAEDPDPARACHQLAVRLLTGAKCKCGKLVSLGAGGATAFLRPVMLDGAPWDIRQSAAAGQCRWTLDLAACRWEPACDAPPLTMPGHR